MDTQDNQNSPSQSSNRHFIKGVKRASFSGFPGGDPDPETAGQPQALPDAPAVQNAPVIIPAPAASVATQTPAAASVSEPVMNTAPSQSAVETQVPPVSQVPATPLSEPVTGSPVQSPMPVSVPPPTIEVPPGPPAQTVTSPQVASVAQAQSLPQASGISSSPQATPQPVAVSAPPPPSVSPMPANAATSPAATLVSPRAQVGSNNAPQQPPTQSGTPKKIAKRNPFGFLVPFFVTLLVLGVAGGSFYLYWSSQQKLANLEKVTPQAYEQYQAKSLVDRVKRHMDLPDETPTITTVMNAESMHQEPFYAKAQDGDKVLVFSKRAILYNPSEDRVIEVGFIRQATPTPVAEATASGQPAVAGVSTQAGTAPTPKVLIKNGE